MGRIPIKTTGPFTHDGSVTSSIGEKYSGAAGERRRRCRVPAR